MDIADTVGQGNPALKSMLEALQGYKPAPPPSQEERQGALQNYTNAIQHAGEDTRQPWEVLLAGRLTAGNPLDANQAGAASLQGLEAWRQTQRESERVRSALAAKAQYDDLVKRQAEFDRELVPTLRAALGKSGALAPTVKVVDGKLVKYDPMTGQTEVLAGTQDQQKQRLYQMFYTKAVQNELPDPEAYAQEQTERALVGFGGMTVKGGPTNNIPGVSATSPSGGLPAPQAAAPAAPQKIEIDPAVLASLSPQDAELAQRLAARMNANPATVEQDLPRLEQLLTGRAQTPAAVPGAPKMVYVDKVKREMEKGTAAETGKALGKEHEALGQASVASGKLINQLETLKQLYSNPNIPQGEYGPQIQALRSGLTSLGIEVKDAADADLADKIAKNFSLHLRTAEGQNLLPGAMSNYEDKLLQSMGPGLGSTAEGRMAQIEMMIEAAKSNQRIAAEANKLAEANRGVLPSDWRTRRDRVMKEEMARLAVVQRAIVSKLQNKGAQ